MALCLCFINEQTQMCPLQAHLCLHARSASALCDDRQAALSLCLLCYPVSRPLTEKEPNVQIPGSRIRSSHSRLFLFPSSVHLPSFTKNLSASFWVSCWKTRKQNFLGIGNNANFALPNGFARLALDFTYKWLLQIGTFIECSSMNSLFSEGDKQNINVFQEYICFGSLTSFLWH